MKFSERQGIVPPKPLQFESMDYSLKNKIWNCVRALLEYKLQLAAFPSIARDIEERRFRSHVWVNLLSEPLDTCPESVRAVAGENASLGKALKVIEDKSGINMHTALREGFTKLYAWSSDAGQIRHGMMDEDTVEVEDAHYMLVSCAAFVNYLKQKMIRAGIKV